MKLLRWQTIYLLSGIAVIPITPFLYLQGIIARRRAGRLPEAEGTRTGRHGEGEERVKLLAIGESTVAGVGASTHDKAFAGSFAKHLGSAIGKSVEWHVVGKSGVTARRTLDELFPSIPDEQFDYILIGLGGNDVLTLSSPLTWRRDISAVIGLLRERNPEATIFLSNCPAINLSPVLPQPLKFILWQLSRLHDVNIKDLTREMENVYYYHQPETVPEDFFADGIHPSESGYDMWAESMIEFFIRHYRWRKPDIDVLK